MEIANLVVREGLVAQKNTKVPQLIQISIETQNIGLGTAHLEWHNLASDGSIVDSEPIVTAQIIFGAGSSWLASWAPMAHFVHGRIEALEQLVTDGVANRLSHRMAYQLFARNLVDYADKYRGMQSVVLHNLEAFADITIKAGTDLAGTWTVPPFFIDSACHLAGFVMNASDDIDTKNDFCVTPGWGSLRLARPLVAGGKYRSYVKMIPTAEDPSVYLGDVYILQDGQIIGVMQAMKFRRYPRVLLNRFFSAPDVKNPSSGVGGASAKAVSAAKPAPVAAPATVTVVKPAEVIPTLDAPPLQIEPAAAPAPASVNVEDLDSTPAKAMQLVASEAGIDLSDLEDDANFANLGVDSLMSLVLAEKLREQLGVTVSGSLFLEYPTVGDLRAWLIECYG